MSLAPEKTLPSLAVINLDKLSSNLGVVRRMSQAKGVMAVVKANAYGHGAVAIAQNLVRLGVEHLAVQTPEEAIQLRQGGVVSPILILGYTHAAYGSDILHYNLTPTIFDYQLAVEINQLSSKIVPVHIKIDTGMSWAGIAVKDALPFIKSVMKLERIKIAGLFTHFAAADSNPEYTKEQADKFLKVVGEVQGFGLKPVLHAANSAAVMNYPKYHFDYVRPGLMLYGVPVGGSVDSMLLPILSWQSVVCDMKVLNTGESVGYGCTFVAQSTRVIAIIPVGYADGWKWQLENGGYVIIKGQKAMIVGRICMDQFMVDVTEIQGVEVGDKVTLIGQDGNLSLTVPDLANIVGTSPYEILTSLGGRIKYRYTLVEKEV